jgi:DNA helicase-2/ATP-dependent DNA helicase PcrA
VQGCLEDFCTPADILPRYHNSRVGQNVVALYSAYRTELLKRNAVDFPSLLLLAYELLSAKPTVAKQFRIIYPHICVDEFQDTNLAQYNLLRLVVGEQPRDLFVVADDDQIIYEWNGASPERLQRLRADYQMAVIQLPTNYRCPPEVIALANNLIRRNLNRSADKEQLVAAKQAGEASAVRLKQFKTQEDEIEYVSQHICDQGREQWSHCAVLARAKWLLDGIVGKLSEKGVPAVISTRKDEFRSSPFRWLHAALRLANDRHDYEQIRRIRKAFHELEGVDITVDAGVDPAADLLSAWLETVMRHRDLEMDTRSFLHRLAQLTRAGFDFEACVRESLAWFEVVSARPGAGPGMDEYRDELQAWQDLYRSAASKYPGEALGLSVLLQEFDLCSKLPPVPPGAVRCYTIHASKGLEFNHVYLIGLTDDILPSYKSVQKGDTSAEVQEERRNCFVAITRTQVDLALSWADRYSGYSRKPSRFLAEMGLLE